MTKEKKIFLTGYFFGTYALLISIFLIGCGLDPLAGSPDTIVAAAPDLTPSSSPDLAPVVDAGSTDDGGKMACESSSRCDDGNPCTTDICAVNGNTSECKHYAVPDCTANVPDLGTGPTPYVPDLAVAPDLAPKPECTNTSDCDDGKACTDDICTVGGKCQHFTIVGCGVDMASPPDLGTSPDLKPTPECTGPEDCDAGDECTAFACEVGGKCRYFGIVGCGMDMAKPPLVCEFGLLICDSNDENGCETKYSDANCGACGNACGAVPHGISGCFINACAIPDEHWCDHDYNDCDGVVSNGCETALTTNTNCGACGNSCQQNESCEAGQCQAVPQAMTCACSWVMPDDATFTSVTMSVAVNDGPMLQLCNTQDGIGIVCQQQGLKTGDTIDISVEYRVPNDKSWSCIGPGNAGKQVGTLKCFCPSGEITQWSPVSNGIGGCNLRATVP